MITPRTVIDAILEGARHTEPTTREFYDQDLKAACVRGAGHIGYLKSHGRRSRVALFRKSLPYKGSYGIQSLLPDEYFTAELKLRNAYEAKYDRTIEDDNDNNLGRELTIQRIKDLYPEVD